MRYITQIALLTHRFPKEYSMAQIIIKVQEHSQARLASNAKLPPRAKRKGKKKMKTTKFWVKLINT